MSTPGERIAAGDPYNEFGFKKQPRDGAIEAIMEDEFSKACRVLFADPKIVKYTEVESAPTAHGLFVTTSVGTTYEVNITRKA